MEPVIVHNILSSMHLLVRRARTLTEKCVRGIKANPSMCRGTSKPPSASSPALNPYLGYEKSAWLAKAALETGGTVRDLTLEKGWLTEVQLDALFDTAKLTAPRRKENIDAIQV